LCVLYSHIRRGMYFCRTFCSKSEVKKSNFFNRTTRTYPQISLFSSTSGSGTFFLIPGVDLIFNYFNANLLLQNYSKRCNHNWIELFSCKKKTFVQCEKTISLAIFKYYQVCFRCSEINIWKKIGEKIVCSCYKWLLLLLYKDEFRFLIFQTNSILLVIIQHFVKTLKKMLYPNRKPDP